MSSRPRLPAALCAALLLALAACQDSSRPTQPASPIEPLVRSDVVIPGCQVGRIGVLANALLPTRSTSPLIDLRSSLTIALTLSQSQLAFAQTLARKIAALLGDQRVIDWLRDPVLTPPETKPQAISELVNLLFVCVQLPPPGDISGAYAPGGAVKIIGTAGGDVIARDTTAAFRVPSGAVTGDHVFTIQRKSDLARAKQCLPNAPGQYNDCYAFSVSPAVTFAQPVLLVMCTLQDYGNQYGTPTQAVHDRLRMASLDHNDPTHSRIRVYDRVPDAIGLDCADHVSIAAAPTSIGGRLASAVSRVASALLAPLTPAPAYAFDGVGSLVTDLTDFTTVDPVQLTTGFEAGDPAWATDGFWQATSFADLVNTAYPSLVSAGAGDLSAGALPAAYGGTRALWFGESATGNYAGELAPGQEGLTGGTSLAPHAGEAVSPAFAIANSVNPVRLSFRSWFEIEAVNSANFDLMDVAVEDVATGQRTPVARLNPPVDPQLGASIPFTSGGANAAPVWTLQEYDLSAYRGRTVRLRFRFDTVDELYNGYRGWIVDDVSVRLGAEQAPFFLRMSAPAVRSVAPAQPRVWRP